MKPSFLINWFSSKLIVLLLLLPTISQANTGLVIEITEGAEGALPIAVVPFKWTGNPAAKPMHDISEIIRADLNRSGRFSPLAVSKMLTLPSTGEEVDFRDWRTLAVENVVVGQVQPNGAGGYLVKFQLFDVFRGEQITSFSGPTTDSNLRSTAHQIADLIYETLTGEAGAFNTRIAYVTSVKKGKKQTIELQIADADGYGPETILESSEPIMSPAWSPDGKKLAYVSFENGKPAIYVQEVYTARRSKLTSFKGINGAPAWSPDGRYLAMTLSKGGNPDIYVMNLNTRKVRQLTRHWGIDTEPAWSPDGRAIVFTSDRPGQPQIYRVNVAGGKPERLTFDGKYNARASYTPDGKHLVMVTRTRGHYRIGTLDLQTRSLNILTNGSLDESPSFAPNGSMVIYATTSGGRAELSAVSFDGRVRQRLALQAGDVREPVWSPYLNQKRNP